MCDRFVACWCFLCKHYMLCAHTLIPFHKFSWFCDILELHWTTCVYIYIYIYIYILYIYTYVYIYIYIYSAHGPPLGYGPYLHPWLLATTIFWYRYCSPQHILRSPLQELWLLCNLITWQNSDAGRMAVPAWNMLSAFFYSPHVGLTSYFCELDINPYFFGNHSREIRE